MRSLIIYQEYIFHSWYFTQCPRHWTI